MLRVRSTKWNIPTNWAPILLFPYPRETESFCFCCILGVQIPFLPQHLVTSLKGFLALFYLRQSHPISTYAVGVWTASELDGQNPTCGSSLRWVGSQTLELFFLAATEVSSDVRTRLLKKNKLLLLIQIALVFQAFMTQKTCKTAGKGLVLIRCLYSFFPFLHHVVRLELSRAMQSLWWMRQFSWHHFIWLRWS